MAATCAQRTAGVDVKHPLRIMALDASIGRIAALRGVAGESPVSAVFETFAMGSTTQQWITQAMLVVPRVCGSKHLSTAPAFIPRPALPPEAVEHGRKIWRGVPAQL
jgi:hypothetical protein